MDHHEKAIKITAQFYAARDSAKVLLGNRYEIRMKQYGAIIQTVAKDYHLDTVAATLKIAKDCHMEGGALMLLLAAAAEILEPSAPAPAGGGK